MKKITPKQFHEACEKFPDCVLLRFHAVDWSEGPVTRGESSVWHQGDAQLTEYTSARLDRLSLFLEATREVAAVSAQKGLGLDHGVCLDVEDVENILKAFGVLAQDFQFNSGIPETRTFHFDD